MHHKDFFSQKKPFTQCKRLIIYFDGGELGIRTPGTFNSSTVFKTAAIDHSASSPGSKVQTPRKSARMNVEIFNYNS